MGSPRAARRSSGAWYDGSAGSAVWPTAGEGRACLLKGSLPGTPAASRRVADGPGRKVFSAAAGGGAPLAERDQPPPNTSVHKRSPRLQPDSFHPLVRWSTVHPSHWQLRDGVLARRTGFTQHSRRRLDLREWHHLRHHASHTGASAARAAALLTGASHQRSTAECAPHGGAAATAAPGAANPPLSVCRR